MGTSEIDLTETFENDLLDIFLSEMSNYPSKILDDEGSPLYTNYEALEVLQKVFEGLINENNLRIILGGKENAN